MRAARRSRSGRRCSITGTGIQAAFAIAAALYQRTVTGKGQHIDVAMLDAAIMLMSSHVTRFHHSGELAPVTGNDSAFNAGYCCYATKEGLLMLGAYTGRAGQKYVGGPRRPRPRRGAGGLDPDGHDRSFPGRQPTHRRNPQGKNRQAGGRSSSTSGGCRRRGCANSIRALADPQLNGRTVLQRLPADANWPATQKLPVAAFQYADAESGPRLRSPPPPPAWHTGEVLGEIGYNEEELLELQNRGVIKMASTDGERG